MTLRPPRHRSSPIHALLLPRLRSGGPRHSSGRGVPSWILLLVLLTLTLPARAQTPPPGENHAGLIVVGPEGDRRDYCVTFSEDSLTGEQLLTRAGLEVNADLGNPLGVTVCSLDGQGCNFPSQSCFCQCQGGACHYWAYFIYHPTRGWIYSALGARQRTLGDGDLDAWVWSSSSSVSDPALAVLPSISLADVCASPATALAPAAASAPLRVSPAYIVFGLLLVGLAALLLFRRRSA